MTCAVTITELTLSLDGLLTVSGSAQECDSVVVQFIDFFTTVPKTAQVDAGGSWQVQFSDADASGSISIDEFRAACGTFVKITAVCASDSACQAPGMFLLTCLGCPPEESVTISVAAQECVDGQHQVTLQAVLPDADHVLFYNWDYGDGSSSNAQPLPAPSAGSSQVNLLEPLPHAYDAGSQQVADITVSLRLYLNNADICVYEFPLHLEPCPLPDCFAVLLEVRDAANQPADAGECLQAGAYSVQVTAPSGTGYSYAWSLDGVQDSSQSGSSYPVSLSAGQTASVSVIVSEDECVVSNGVTLSECTQPDEPDEPDVPEEPEEPQEPEEPEEPEEPDDTPPPTFNPCWAWFWTNIAAFIITAIVILVTFCLFDASVWSAVAALASGGTLTAVFGAMTALNVAMLIISVVLLLACLASFILWIIVCAFGRMRNIICSVLTLLMSILSVANGISFILALIFSFSGMVGCAAGAWIDVAWFSILMSITWFTGLALGCFTGGSSILRR